MYCIRLQGPWVMIGPDTAEPRRIRLPLEGAEAQLAGDTPPPAPVRLQRNFQRPTNLDPEERVLLVLPPGAVAAELSVGEQAASDPRWLGDCQTWDLTNLLTRSNVLNLTLVGTEWAAALREPILLGIMPDADGSWWIGLPFTR
ncbi:MAG: hypothetical protein KDA75_22165 [Planctomycetaceae bacterium]|nr:hypothetical protein [Planctomycetaceae bacterium]